jgi:hypothetical protein
MNPFEYPAAGRRRRHGPRGYSHHRSYREWLRDEFAFRCVFCLTREQWGRTTGTFHVDHLQPISLYPEKRNDYDNLLYACVTCNERKLDRVVPDPLIHMTNATVEIASDGSVKGLTKASRSIIRMLDLAGPETMKFRAMWFRFFGMAQADDPALYCRLMAYPDDLPNLAALRPPGGNTRPDGIAQSHHARRARGELPATY